MLNKIDLPAAQPDRYADPSRQKLTELSRGQPGLANDRCECSPLDRCVVWHDDYRADSVAVDTVAPFRADVFEPSLGQCLYDSSQREVNQRRAHAALTWNEVISGVGSIAGWVTSSRYASTASRRLASASSTD
jgi:hypothetical protein